MYPARAVKPPDPPMITPFEAKALAYADLVVRVLKENTPVPAPSKEIKHVEARHSTVRCVCGDTTSTNDMVQCSECKCYLHASCLGVVRRVPQKPVRCPFCRLQSDGIDPFSDLQDWISQMNKIFQDIGDTINSINHSDSELLDRNSFALSCNATLHKIHDIIGKITDLTQT